MTYIETLNQIKKKQFSPMYLLHGTESYFIEKIKQNIITYGLDDLDRETNISIYDLEETSIQEVIADTETYPFFGERKIIFANNPIFLKAKPDKAQVEHDLQALQNYLTHPVDYSILIFVAPFEKLDERKKITKLCKKHCQTVSCDSIKEWELDKWINQLAKDFHLKIEESAIEFIIQETGANLLMLQTEMEKMALYVGEDGTITKSIAEKLVSHQLNTTGLKLVDAVIQQDLQKAISIFKDLDRMNEDPIALLALLASQFRTILHVKILKQKGYSQPQMAQQLKVHPYVIKMSVSREKNFSASDLSSFLDKCTDTDTKIKQGIMEKSLAFELLLYELINKKGKGMNI
ncbi:DNA polymerase III subunit delta [Aquibacillus albus]|uniref:DNA polymerase III subunit delta n=1 Tax=Aquibacillus albus TaxID=1168171 RepID=A0ABS2MUL7_9BACI|nr:DNA polymerase III subunit delta [Aquibacillus albus]MBM7569604.1 DNA polymerase-3 subunit delta [Aquibacillus albus]